MKQKRLKNTAANTIFPLAIASYSALITVGCGDGSGSTDDPDLKAIVGSWQTECTPGENDYTQSFLEFTSSKTFNYLRISSPEATCQAERSYSLEAKGSFTIDDSTDELTLLSFTPSSIELTPLTEETSDSFNSAAYCENVFWELDTPFSVAGKSCELTESITFTENGKTHEQIIEKQSDGVLFLGNSFLENISTRPDEVAEVAYNK